MRDRPATCCRYWKTRRLLRLSKFRNVFGSFKVASSPGSGSAAAKKPKRFGQSLTTFAPYLLIDLPNQPARSFRAVIEEIGEAGGSPVTESIAVSVPYLSIFIHGVERNFRRPAPGRPNIQQQRHHVVVHVDAAILRRFRTGQTTAATLPRRPPNSSARAAANNCNLRYRARAASTGRTRIVKTNPTASNAASTSSGLS